MSAAVLSSNAFGRLQSILQHHKPQPPPPPLLQIEAIPGSPEKILLLRGRAAAEQVLCRPGDPVMPINMAWEIRVEPNGRIVHKTLINFATKQIERVVVHDEETGLILEDYPG